MAIEIGTLVFTQEEKFQGIQYLGKLNIERTIAKTIVQLSKRYGGAINPHEIQEYINFQVAQLREKKSYPHVEDLQDIDIQTIKGRLANVVRRSTQSPGKFIPQGITKLSYCDGYIYREVSYK